MSNKNLSLKVVATTEKNDIITLVEQQLPPKFDWKTLDVSMHGEVFHLKKSLPAEVQIKQMKLKIEKINDKILKLEGK
jgi:hypothetical protein